MNPLVTITGASGNAGQAVARLVAAAGFRVRLADMMPPPSDVLALGEFVRCDTRTVSDVQQAVAGSDAVIHLAAWHSAHRPPVSDATIFGVNIDGTFNVFEACREYSVKSIVYASSMAYGWSSVYGLTKVLGEEMCRTYHEMMDASIVMLRYHEFVPSSYLVYGPRLLRNGVDRSDVAAATIASLKAVVERRVGLFRTIVHTNHGIPAETLVDFPALGRNWIGERVPGAGELIDKYQLPLPDKVEQHDLSEAANVLDWRPSIGFVEFMTDLRDRDAAGEDVASLWVPGALGYVSDRSSN